MAWTISGVHEPINGASATSLAKALGSSVAVGDGILAWVTWGTTATAPSSFGDDLGNIYTLCPGTDLADGGNTQYSRLYFAPVTVAGSPTVTATWAVAVPYRGMTLAKSSTGGTISLEASTGQNQAAGGTPDAKSSGNVTPTVDDCAIVSFTQDTSAGAVAITDESTTIVNTGGTDGCSSQVEIQTTAAPIAGDFSYASPRVGLTCVAALKSVTGGGSFIPDGDNGLAWMLAGARAVMATALAASALMGQAHLGVIASGSAADDLPPASTATLAAEDDGFVRVRHAPADFVVPHPAGFGAADESITVATTLEEHDHYVAPLPWPTLRSPVLYAVEDELPIAAAPLAVDGDAGETVLRAPLPFPWRAFLLAGDEAVAFPEAASLAFEEDHYAPPAAPWPARAPRPIVGTEDEFPTAAAPSLAFEEAAAPLARPWPVVPRVAVASEDDTLPVAAAPTFVEEEAATALRAWPLPAPRPAFTADEDLPPAPAAASYDGPAQHPLGLTLTAKVNTMTLAAKVNTMTLAAKVNSLTLEA